MDTTGSGPTSLSNVSSKCVGYRIKSTGTGAVGFKAKNQLAGANGTWYGTYLHTKQLNQVQADLPHSPR